MRSIGKRNIKLVKMYTIDALKEGTNDVEERTLDALPLALWNTWECADQQIRRIVRDTIWNTRREF
ncbi:MAG: hypothetical protein ACXQTI_08225 [Candidatus Nezhaarchaeales archaeon]